MRTKGKITHWKGDKGYGFITPASGQKQVFVHINSFIKRSRSPQTGQLVEFDLSTDKQGRPCAVRVTRPSEKLSGDKRNDKLFYVLGAVFFLVAVAFAVLTGSMPWQVLVAYLVASALTYFFYAWDKSAAQAGAWRTQ
jgi:cold shock CspA family protein